VTPGYRLVCLNAKTGEPIDTFGDHGAVDLKVGVVKGEGEQIDLETGEVVAASGVMNPQIRFGEDLMSRVSYVMMNPGGDHELTSAVRTALNDLIAALALYLLALGAERLWRRR